MLVLITNFMGDLLTIAPRLLAALLILAVGIYLANLGAGIVSRSNIYRSRITSQLIRIFIITLAGAIALQQAKIATDMAATSASQPAEVAVAVNRNHRQNIWTNVSIGGGGYVTGIYLHPLEKDLVYIRTDIGGFYRWNPKDSSWIPLTDRFPLEMSRYYGGESLALDLKDPNIVYIAAGDQLWHDPGTIFKSSDRGATWKKLNIDLKMGSNHSKRWAGERLAISPSNSNLIFFGSRRDGLWKSSDAGATWAKITTFTGNPKKNVGVLSIVFDKQVPNLVYVNAYGDGIYRSTDMGSTWRKILESPATANRMTVASDSTLYLTSSKSPGVSKYVRGVWSDITPSGAEAAFNGLSVNPHNPKELIVSTGENTYTKIYHSTDGGATWTQKKRSINNTVPWWQGILLKQPWISAIEFDPQVADRVWLTDWYGIWRTDNIKANPVVWTNYQNGHEEIVAYTAVSPPSGSLLLSGVADVDGFRHDNGLDTYPSQKFGASGPSFQDTHSLAYCENDPRHMVRIGGNRTNNTYSGATSKDGGKTWQKFASFPENAKPIRVAMSATNPKLIIVTLSESQPIRTTDGGASWQTVSGLPKGPSEPRTATQSLAADTVDGNTFYYYWNDNIYRSIDGGASFSVVYTPLIAENRWHLLKPMPGVKGELWGAFDRKGLYRSADGGSSWAKIAGVERAYLFAFGKPKPGSTIPVVYLYGKITGMGQGIFRSLDRGKTWINITDPNNPVGKDPLFMEASKQKFGLVFVGTGGRGIFYYQATQ